MIPGPTTPSQPNPLGIGGAGSSPRPQGSRPDSASGEEAVFTRRSIVAIIPKIEDSSRTGGEMNAHHSMGLAAVVIAALVTTTSVAQTKPPTSGPAEGGSPAWFLQGSFPDPGGNTVVDA